MSKRSAEQGWTRLEFASVVAIFAVMFGVFLNSVRFQQEQAERLVVDLTVMGIRTGLLSEAADRLIKGKGRDTADILKGNPLRWLNGFPTAYQGEFKEAPTQEIPRGSWYFEQKSGELVYKLNLSSNYERVDGGSEKEIRWRVQPRKGVSPDEATVDELTLTPTVVYKWFN